MRALVSWLSLSASKRSGTLVVSTLLSLALLIGLALGCSKIEPEDRADAAADASVKPLGPPQLGRIAQAVTTCTGQPDYTPFDTGDGTTCTDDVCIGGVPAYPDNGTCACTCQPTTATINNFNSSSDYGVANTTDSTTTGTSTPGGYALNKVITNGITTHTKDAEDVFATVPNDSNKNIQWNMALGSSLSASMSGYTTLRIRMACYGSDDVGCRNGFTISLGNGATTLGQGTWYSQTLNNIVAQGFFTGHTKDHLKDVDIPLNATTFNNLPALSNIHQLRLQANGGAATRNWRIDGIELRGGAGGNCTYPGGATCGCSTDAGCHDGNLCTTDACTGTSPNKVCTYTNLSAGTVCRSAAGGCDAAETCAGGGAQCPADAKRANGYVCRSAVAGGCDVQETCNGTSDGCPTDAFQASGTTCRAATGACDVTETCSGSSNGCPVDAKVSSGTVCRAPNGTCDAPETCNGSSGSCPSDAFLSAGTSCRAAAGLCDAVEACTGSSAACPADALLASGAVCRGAVAGGCDVAETCSGSSTACPSDVVVATGTVCRAAVEGGCDMAETCDGTNACPTDVVAQSGAACTDDNDPCTVDVCNGSAACPRTIEGASCQPCGNNTLSRSAATASTTISGSSTANAIDTPTNNTRWESVHGQDPQWIYVDLGNGNKHITTVVIDWESASAKDYTISVAVDGTTSGTLATDGSHWTTLATVNDPSNAQHRIKTHNVSGVGRYVRMKGTTRTMPAYGYSIWDFTVKGDTNNVCGTSCSPTCGACATCNNGTCVAVAAGTECRASAGACDVAETCNGSAQTCPANAFKASGVTCREALPGGCDVAEVCVGGTAACPADGFVTSGTVCRIAAGTCDVAETCSGIAGACPADAKVASGTVCRTANGVCDAQETCNGSSSVCPADVFATGTVCRTASGLCDAQETCSGSSATCPADALAAAGTVCRTPSGACDAAETCSGSASSCPADALSAAGTVCRVAAGGCDVTETCNGSVNSCPADVLQSSGFVCRAAIDGGCDVAETCSGSVASCPTDVVAPAGTACTEDKNSCTIDSCNGTSGACPRTEEDSCQDCGNTELTRTGAVASSTTGSNLAANAIDNHTSNPSTRWESAQGSDPQWIYVDLGADRHISGVQLDWESASAKNYTIQVSLDGTCSGSNGSGCVWTTIHTSPTLTGNQQHRIDNITASGMGRYVRMHGTSRTTNYGYSLYNFKVTGDANAECDTCSPSCGTCSDAPEQTPLTLTHLGNSGSWSSIGNAIDGNESTAADKPTTGTEYIDYSLGGAFTINRARINEDNSGQRNIENWNLQYWNGSSYVDAFALTNTPTAGWNEKTFAPVTTDRVRIRMQDTGHVEVYEIQVFGGTGVCGDGDPGAGEQCDDGNTTNGDGCSATCETELCLQELLTPVTATASSQENSIKTALKAIDGDINGSESRWSSAFSDPQWLKVDFGATRKISRVWIKWESSASADYDLQTSDDGTTWTTIYSDHNANGGIDDIGKLTGTGRYLRVYSRARTTQYGNSIYEIQTYGDTDPSCKPRSVRGFAILSAAQVVIPEGAIVEGDIGTTFHPASGEAAVIISEGAQVNGTVFGESVTIEGCAHVDIISTNTLISVGSHSSYDHLMPYVAVPALPPVTTVAVGASSRVVNDNEEVVFDEDEEELGDVTMGEGSTVTLIGNKFRWRSLYMASNAELVVRAGSTLFILDSIIIGDGARVRRETSGSNPFHLQFVGDLPASCQFGIAAYIDATMLAPNGICTVGAGTQFTGAVGSDTLLPGIGGIVSLPPGFDAGDDFECSPADQNDLCADGNQCTASNCEGGICDNISLNTGTCTGTWGDGLCKLGTCQPAHCYNSTIDEGEGGLNCGGFCPTGCPEGGICNVDEDCDGDLTCQSGFCEPDHCENDEQDEDETGEDCGGSCPDGCGSNGGCNVEVDCNDEMICQDQQCNPEHCDDDEQDGDETGVDCGGACPACGEGGGCATGEDCAVGSQCILGLCLRTPGCSQATCSNPSDGRGGVCRGVCAVGDEGCTSDLTCPVDSFCAL
jgi:hypothetical protein